MRGAFLCVLVLAACSSAAAPEEDVVVNYGGIETRLLDSDLVNFIVQTSGADEAATLAYADCAAAQYTLIRGYGFARPIRTNISNDGAGLIADAVYTISPDLPRGSRTIDAQVVVADCAASGIPTV